MSVQVAIVSKGLHLYSTRRLNEASLALNLEPVLVDPSHCLVLTSVSGSQLLLDGATLKLPEMVIARTGTDDAPLSIAVLRHLELRNSVALNASHAIMLAKDKYAALQLLAAHGIPVPRTFYLRDPFQLEKTFELLGDPPYVLKLKQGSQGIGVLLAESRASAESMVDALWSLGSHVLIQEFVRGSYGEDMRALVLGEEVVGAVRRTAKTGHFRSNIHLGAEAKPIDLTSEQAKLALRAAATLGLRMAGIDMVQTSNGETFVLEANASPGFEGIERATGIDVAGKTIMYLRSLHEQQCKNKGSRPAGVPIES